VYRLAPVAAGAATIWALCTLPVAAESPPERWNGPFGGQFHASFTVASDYAQSGISSTQNQPAFQAQIDWHSPYLLANGPPLRVYTNASITNVSFPDVGPGVEVDLGAGVKLGLLDKRLNFDLGYTRYVYPTYSADASEEWGEWSIKGSYDFGPVIVEGRLRYSPDTTLHDGREWNKRGLVTVPLDFLPLPDGLGLKTYGSLGNVWIEKAEILGLPRNDWWYWQVGLVVSAIPLGVDITVAYTDTNIEAEHCGHTRACEGRLFVSVTKVF
jgi:uncharacterized protein (TIGR02001 family)